MAGMELTHTKDLTTGEIAGIVHAPAHRIRRVVDRLEPNLPRAGRYRLVPVSLIPAIVADLEKNEARCVEVCRV